MKLSEKNCVPCKGGIPAFDSDQIANYLKEVKGWAVVENHHLTKTYSFPDFKTGLAFVNRVGELAEQQDHHPDISLSWGKVRIDIWTHKINGLSENDFILAAKCDELVKFYNEQK